MQACRDPLGFAICYWFTVRTVPEADWEDALVGIILCYKSFCLS